MRTKEIDKWVQEGGDLPQELTEDEEVYLRNLGLLGMKGFYPNGQKLFHYLTINGKDHGKCEYWHPNGQKMIERYYCHDKDHGSFRLWDKDGNLVKDEEYYYGNKIK